MSRAHTRSSSRMSSLSRASNVSTATSSSRLTTLLDDFDMRASTPIKKHTTNLLVPKRENPEYENLRKEVYRSRYRSREDSAATLIQKTMRMFMVKKKIIATLQSHKKMRMKRILLFFNVLLLNTTKIKLDRRKVYGNVLMSATFLRKFYRGYKPASNEIYAATGMMTIPPYIDETILIQFVYSFYKSRLRLMLEEWHVIACRSRQLARHSKRFKLDQMSMLKFGIFYRTFAIWLNFTRIKRNRRLSTIDIPQWNHFMKSRLRKQKQLEKATEFRKKTICENAVQALRNLVLHHRHYKRFFEQAIEYNLKKSMKFALSAWIKYLILQQNKSITMRFVFRRWLQSVQRRKHLIMLSNALSKRHEYYQKRLIVDILTKNKKVSQCLNMYQYLRIMQKPSLALYFISILRKDIYSESLSHTFTAWIDLVRRRRRWLHFVFMNEVNSEYTPKKRLFLAALRHYALPTLTPICLYSDRFKKESMYMYHNVMNEKVDPSSIYLIVNGDTPDEVKKAASKTKTRIQQREVFFKIWKSQKNHDFSLFMRSAVVYCAKKASITMRDAESIPDLCYKQYKKVISFLYGMNIASDSKFRAALQTVNENNKKNLMNRMSCLHRDNLIVLAHDSHSDAIDLHDVNSVFKNSDDFVKTKKIVEASEKLAQSFQPLIPIDKLGAVLEQPNEDQFVFVDGCRSQFKSFKPIIIECHNIIQCELVRSEIGHDVASRFDKLLSGHDLSASAKNGAHSNSRVDSYIRYKGDNPPPKSRPSTGINDKLSSKFPQRNRKAKIIGKETETFNLSELQPIELNDGNQKSEEEEISELKQTTKDSYDDDIKKIKRTKSIANVFSNEKTFLNSIMSRSQEKIEKYIDHNEEEDHLMEELKKLKNQYDSDDDSDAKFEIDQTLVDGFDRSTMMSLKQAKDIQSPRTAKKYKLFLEILFGRAAKEVNNVQVNKLRQRILNEYKNKKSSFAACGINTKYISRPVSGILGEYRRKDEYSPVASTRKDKDKDNNKENQSTNAKEDENQYYQTYNSRRYKFRKKAFSFDDDESELNSKNKNKNDQDQDQNQNENDNENKNEDNNNNENENKNENDNDNDNNKNDNENGNDVSLDSKRNDDPNEKNSQKDNENEINRNSYSSDSEFRENLDDDDNRGKKSFFEDIDNENEIRNGKEDENFEDTEFDPAAKEKLLAEKEEEEDKKEEEKTEEKTENEKENKTDKKISPTRKRKKSSRRISTATPYTSMNKNEGSPISKVDRIAIKLLSEQIPDENGYGLLVDVDPEQMPPLRLIKQEGSSLSESDGPTVYLPGYKDRKRIKVTSKLHKRTIPIVIPNKTEMTPNMRLAYHESDNFDKLLLVNGKSQYVHAQKKESSNKFIPHYSHIIKNSSSSDLGEFDKGAFIENQVVSFQGGGRQIGTQSPNFINVRIQQGKQRGLIKPFVFVEGSPKAATLKNIKEQSSSPSNQITHLKASSSLSNSNSNTNSASSNSTFSHLDNRAVSSHVRDITNKIVTSLAMNVEELEMLETFWQRSKAILKKNGSLILNSNMADVNHKIYESLIEINYDYSKDNNFLKTANGLLTLASKYSPYSPVLVDAIEKARKIAKQPKNVDENQKNQMKKQKNKNRIDLDFTSSGIETSWMTDLDYNYNAVALQYRDDNENDGEYIGEKKNLDAIIASTKPQKLNSKKRPRTEMLPERKWDDVLKNYNISDMMLVTPYIIPENVVDDFLDEYRKSLKIQMH